MIVKKYNKSPPSSGKHRIQPLLKIHRTADKCMCCCRESERESQRERVRERESESERESQRERVCTL